MGKTSVTVDNIRVPLSADDGDITEAARKILRRGGVPFDESSLRIRKKSVDARKKNNITFVCSVSAECIENSVRRPQIPGVRYFGFEDEIPARGDETMDGRPYIVGFGPAGMFCALILAENGMRPVVVERGSDVRRRVEKVENFYRAGILDTNTNIQFGAGGAGTFSDGKLITRIGDRRTEKVLRALVSFGAPDDILWKAKPHVGTDILRIVIENAAAKIAEFGGEIRYDSTVQAVADGKIKIDGQWEKCGCAVVAPGHSARDLYSSLMSGGYIMEAKPFSVGVRAEHLQAELDHAMYGDESVWEKAGHAEYALSLRRGERGVYTFCMCPGGEVVAAASEEGGVVTNGMSRRMRDSGKANAAVAVSVLPSDFGNNPMGAVEFQRHLERAAFKAGGGDYSAPCQSMGNFYMGREGGFSDRILPSYMNSRVKAADFNKLLPQYIVSMLKEGFADFGRKIKGYNAPDGPLTGIETRTSAPLRILRDDSMCAIGHSLVFPCGEGAGSAGGITSAAVDGIRVAEAILGRFKA